LHKGDTCRTGEARRDRALWKSSLEPFCEGVFAPGRDVRQEGKKAEAQQEFERAYQLEPELKKLPLP